MVLSRSRSRTNMHGRYGRKAARYTYASIKRSHIMAVALNALGAPPASCFDYTAAVTAVVGDDWTMMANDQLGCCTCSDAGHQRMIRSANSGTIYIPTATEVVDLYENFGYNPANPNTDEGVDELTVMEFLRDHGAFGTKIDAFANLIPTNLDHLKWAVQIYGASRLGLNLPTSAPDQFDAGKPWDVVPGATVDGGHDVPLVSYVSSNGETRYYVVTWGRLQEVTEAFLIWVLDDGTPVLEEAHAEAADDLLLSTGFTPAHYDHATLIGDLNAVRG